MKLTIAVTISYLAVLALAAVELLKYSGVIQNYLHVEFWWIISAVIAFTLFGRLTQRTELTAWPIVQFNNRVVLPLTALLSIILFGLESYTYTNFVFSTFRINHLILIDVLLLSFFFKLITSPWQQLKKWAAGYFFTAFLLICFFIYHYFYPLFASISLNASGQHDDNLMEWVQVVTLVVGALITTSLTIKAKAVPLKVLYIGATVFFILLAGEEISWGERFFSFSIRGNDNNYQNEFNIHNQSGVNEVTALLYILAFLYAVSSWGIRRWAEHRKVINQKNRQFWNFFTFRGVEALYLLPTFIFNPYADRTLFPPIPPILNIYSSLGLIPDFLQTLSFLAAWRETFEVLFYLALVLHFAHIWLAERSVKANKVKIAEST